MSDSPLPPEMEAVGYVGIGALIGFWLCAFSLASWFWFRVPWWFRVMIGIVLSALVVGYFQISKLYASAPVLFPELLSPADLFTFIGKLAVFTLPMLSTGYGYPGLCRKLFSRSAKDRAT